MESRCSGFDEAGLGPLLGPLVVASCSWRGTAAAGPGKVEMADKALLPGLEWPAQSCCPHCRLGQSSPLAAVLPARELGLLESKTLYRQRRDFGRLELWALAFVQQQLGSVTTVAELLTVPLLADEALARLTQLPWYQGLAELRLPLAAQGQQLSLLTAKLAGAHLHWDFRARLLTANELNQHFAVGFNKADLHAAEMAALLRATGSGCHLVDRWGGRKYYLGHLQEVEPGLRVVCQTAEQSSYANQQCCFHFIVGADRSYPEVAVASIIAKYVRELCMHAFNRYWQQRCPQLPCTSGYAVDAKRWLAVAKQAGLEPVLPQLRRQR